MCYRQRAEIDDIVMEVGALVQFGEAGRRLDGGGGRRHRRRRRLAGSARRVLRRAVLDPDAASARRTDLRQAAQTALQGQQENI